MIGSSILAMSKRIRYGSTSSRNLSQRSYKIPSDRSVGLISNRSNSFLSNRSTGIRSNRSSGKDIEDIGSSEQGGVEDATRCLYQQRALRNGIDGACSVEAWQQPLVAIREYYISFPPPAFEAPPRRISITNLMTSLVDSPKKPLIKPLSVGKLESQTRGPFSYCVIN